jgi:hypothetical protein
LTRCSTAHTAPGAWTNSATTPSRVKVGETVRLCHSAGLRPELGKPGLLRSRLVGTAEEDGKSRGGSQGPDGRRPADVYLPSWRVGNPAALDFAVTSGLRIRSLNESALDGNSPTTLYAARKRSFLDTDAHCRDEGIEFIPMSIEASGGRLGCSWG